MKKVTRKLLTCLLLGILILTGCTSSVATEVADTQPEVKTTQGATTETATEDTGEVESGETQESNSDEESSTIEFVDDMDKTISLDQACQRIIVLYSAHTENLYSLGVGDKIIGVNRTSIYPPDAATKPVYSYRSDPEKVIAAEPDCMLIRPFINRKSPDFVSAVEKAGITVISLYPESFDVFDEYINRLGMMTGTEDVAAEQLEQFYAKIDAISKVTAPIEPKMHAYFESTETNYRTVTTDSMAARAIEFAGGINIATNVEPITERSSIASYGVEKILSNAEKIDVYISQRGAMNAGGSVHSISIREGFNNIKAVRNGNILVINQKLVSSPTFRYYKGVREIARALYPDVMDELDSYRSDEMVTREGFAEIIVRYTHRQIFVPSSSKYYQQEHSGHIYGFFQDVAWDDPSFDYIETAVLAGLMDGKENEAGEYFAPEDLVTKDELAKTVFIMGDYEIQNDHTKIEDLDQCNNDRIVQILVDNGVFELDEGKFHPEQPLTYNQLIDFLKSLELD